jgi:hypothetical protein
MKIARAWERLGRIGSRRADEAAALPLGIADSFLRQTDLGTLESVTLTVVYQDAHARCVWRSSIALVSPVPGCLSAATCRSEF